MGFKIFGFFVRFRKGQLPECQDALMKIEEEKKRW
jgi:hypothetical protein